jgi:hypothetical protein
MPLEFRRASSGSRLLASSWAVAVQDAEEDIVVSLKSIHSGPASPAPVYTPQLQPWFAAPSALEPRAEVTQAMAGGEAEEKGMSAGRTVRKAKSSLGECQNPSMREDRVELISTRLQLNEDNPRRRFVTTARSLSHRSLVNTAMTLPKRTSLPLHLPPRASVELSPLPLPSRPRPASLRNPLNPSTRHLSPLPRARAIAATPLLVTPLAPNSSPSTPLPPLVEAP